MILTVGNTKGGVGKTTLAVQIAIARALAGREVWLIDGDRQGTAAAAVAARADGGRKPGMQAGRDCQSWKSAPVTQKRPMNWPLWLKLFLPFNYYSKKVQRHGN